MEETLIARRIKKIRAERELTLEEVAKRTGFTKGLLSKIENNKVSPPVSTLAKIARALDVSLGELFADVDARPVRIMRKNERTHYLPESGQVTAPLVSGFPRQKMEPTVITIENPGTFQPRYYNHPGQEFILVLAGSMVYLYGNEDFTLAEGDSLYFNSDTVHGPRSVSGTEVTYLSVLCP